MTFNEFKKEFENVEVHEYKNSVNDAVVVSVCIVTYNHAEYITQCLDSIVNQKVSFNYEILIGDDDSTDGTREICKEYAQKYPDKIRLFLHDRGNNIAIDGRPTGRFNFIYNLYSARGKYIAFCEGDDYWIDENKLQKQVDVLNSNTNANICFHNAYIIENNDKHYKGKVYPQGRKEIVEFEDLLKGDYTKTSCCIIRNENHIFNTPVLMLQDTTLFLDCLAGGKVAVYIDNEMSVYRLHSGGVWSLINVIDKRISTFTIYEYLSKKYIDKSSCKIISFQLKKIAKDISYYYLKSRNFNKFLFWLKKSWEFKSYLGLKTQIRLIIKHIT